MQRRDLFKKMGLVSLGLVASAAIIPKVQAQDPIKKKLIVNRQKMMIADVKNPTKFELKHSPEINFGEKDAKGFTSVSIQIGQQGIIHPTSENHWIDYMNIYKNDALVSKMVFENGPIRGYANHYINLKSGDVLKVEIGCNLHGIWESSKTYKA